MNLRKLFDMALDHQWFKLNRWAVVGLVHQPRNRF